MSLTSSSAPSSAHHHAGCAASIAQIGRELFACAARAGNSQHKRAYTIQLPALVLDLAAQIAHGRYRPQPFTVFAVTDPKLREIFAPAFGWPLPSCCNRR